MCKVRKIHLLAINGLMWTAIGTKISITGISHYLTTPAEKLWWMIPLSFLVFAGFYMNVYTLCPGRKSPSTRLSALRDISSLLS